MVWGSVLYCTVSWKDFNVKDCIDIIPENIHNQIILLCALTMSSLYDNIIFRTTKTAHTTGWLGNPNILFNSPLFFLSFVFILSLIYNWSYSQCLHTLISVLILCTDSHISSILIIYAYSHTSSVTTFFIPWVPSTLSTTSITFTPLFLSIFFTLFSLPFTSHLSTSFIPYPFAPSTICVHFVFPTLYLLYYFCSLLLLSNDSLCFDYSFHFLFSFNSLYSFN